MKKWMDCFEEYVIAVFICAMVLFETANAVLHVTGSEAVGLPQEFAVYFYVWIAFLSMSFCAKKWMRYCSNHDFRPLQQVCAKYPEDGLQSDQYCGKCLSFGWCSWFSGKHCSRRNVIEACADSDDLCQCSSSSGIWSLCSA